MRIAVGSDHAGVTLKQALIAHLTELGHDLLDLGTDTTEAVDYPDYGAAVGRAVVSGHAERGVCICGTGIGIGIAANKVSGVRAAVVHDVSSAKLARAHNAANVICFGARLVGEVVALDSIDAFLATEFGGGRHTRRIEKISDLDGSGATAPAIEQDYGGEAGAPIPTMVLDAPDEQADEEAVLREIAAMEQAATGGQDDVDIP